MLAGLLEWQLASIHPASQEGWKSIATNQARMK
jgi:hypothetical protein